MATYVNDLRLKEITTGDESGTWGTSTNTNLELIAEAFSYGTEVITTNADTHTTTIADGATDPGRSLYLKYTGTLDSACTITIGPNTVSKVWIIENGTSGSQNIIISQGSGANITIPAGDTKVVYSDGAGAGAAFVDAFASLSVVDLKVQDDLTVTDDASIGGDATITGTLGVTGNITGTLATAAQPNITSLGTLTGLTTTGDINFGDNDKAIFGAGSDLQIYHDGSHSYITESGTGDFFIQGNNLIIENTGGDHYFRAVNGGAVQIYYSGSEKLATTATGINVTGTATMDAAKVETSTTSTVTISESTGSGTAELRFVATDSFPKTKIVTDVSAGSLSLETLGNDRLKIANNGDISFYDDTGTSQALFWDASAESLGIGTTSPANKLTVTADDTFAQDSSGQIVIKGSSNNSEKLSIGFDTTSDYGYIQAIETDVAARSIALNPFAGNVGIGTSSPSEKLEIAGAVSASSTGIAIKNGSATRLRIFHNDLAGTSYINSHDVGAAQTLFILSGSNLLLSGGGGTEHARIVPGGNLLVGKTAVSNTTKGATIDPSGEIGVTLTNAGGGSQCIFLNREDADGDLILFRQANSTEGSISVSGATVSYNGFSGNHETSGISTDTEIGTVCSTIDELDTYTSGTKEGQTRADHAKIKVSDTVGDTRVYGVLTSYSETDNKPVVASVGIGSIKVTGACSGGDLLESNGDGTAKVQSDDIVRSKTIGKVTIGNSDTGVKLVSCVLYCG
jgi:hypothetical protein